MRLIDLIVVFFLCYKIPKYNEYEENEFIKLNDLIKDKSKKYLNGNYVYTCLDF